MTEPLPSPEPFPEKGIFPGGGLGGIIFAFARRCPSHCPYHGGHLDLLPRLFRAANMIRGRDRLEYLGDMEEEAFVRRFARDRHQLVWELTSSPFELAKAVLATKETHALGRLSEALEDIGSHVVAAWTAADPMDWPDAPQRLAFLRLTLEQHHSDVEFDSFLCVALEEYAVLAGPGAARDLGCKRIRYHLPVAPWGFGGQNGARDETLIGRGLEALPLLGPKQRTYVQALSASRLPLRPANRDKLVEILAERTSWM